MNPKRNLLVLPLALMLVSLPEGRARAKPVRLTPKQAVQRALKHNLGLKYERLAPELTTAPERVARAVFDTTLFSNLNVSGDVDGLALSYRPGFDTRLDADVGVRKTLVTGTRLEATLGGLLGFGGDGQDPWSATYQAGLTLTVRHPLLPRKPNR